MDYLPPRQDDEDLHLRQTRSPDQVLSNDAWHFRHCRVTSFTSASCSVPSDEAGVSPAGMRKLSFAIEPSVLSVIIIPHMATMSLSADDGLSHRGWYFKIFRVKSARITMKITHVIRWKSERYIITVFL